MASSGWQSEKTWYTYSSNVRLVGNINVQSITHSGTNLRIQGQIAAGARGTSGYYFHFDDYTSYAQPESGSKIALGSKGKTWKVGDADTKVSFDVTIANVSASTTSRNFSVNFYGPNTTSVKATLTWSLTFNPSGDPPTGYSVADVVAEWDRITFTSIVGTPNGALLEHSPSISKQALVSGISKYQNTFISSDVSTSITSTVSNDSTPLGNPNWTIQGCGLYYMGAFFKNANATAYGQGGSTYTPPSPSTFSYTDPGGDQAKTYPVVFAGNAANNNTTYDTANLTRTVRYKVNNGNWTYVVQDQQALIDDTTSFSVTVPAGQVAVVEGWQTYHGVASTTTTLTLNNTNQPNHLYGSVGGEAKEITKLYASVGGVSVEVVKLYGSVNGVSKQIY